MDDLLVAAAAISADAPALRVNPLRRPKLPADVLEKLQTIWSGRAAVQCVAARRDVDPLAGAVVACLFAQLLRDPPPYVLWSTGPHVGSCVARGALCAMATCDGPRQVASLRAVVNLSLRFDKFASLLHPEDFVPLFEHPNVVRRTQI